MFRFLLGIATGTVFVAMCLVSLHIIGRSISPPPAQVVELREPVTTPLKASDALVPQEVAEARAGLAANLELRQEIQPDAPLPEVSDREAVQSARFAAAMRGLTGGVPDTRSASSGSLIRFGGGRFHGVTDAYYTTWDDLLKRCHAAVAGQERMNTDGLTPHGEDRIDYGTPDTEQVWFSADKAFRVKLSLNSSYSAPRGVTRMCLVETNRFARAEPIAVEQLKPRFHDWWSGQRFAASTKPVKDIYSKSKSHEKYHGKTDFGSQQGCPMYVKLDQLKLGGETEAMFYLWETTEDGCNASAATGAGGVRINRLPQAGD